jgi:hypothetical protein
MKSRAERQLEFRRIDRWLLEFSKRSPVLFCMFCAGLGCCAGALLIELMDFVDKVNP